MASMFFESLDGVRWASREYDSHIGDIRISKNVLDHKLHGFTFFAYVGIRRVGRFDSDMCVAFDIFFRICSRKKKKISACR